MQVRVARPTENLDAVVRFYAEDLGLPALDRFSGRVGYDRVLLGLPGADHHLEFTAHVDGAPGPAPTGETLLVLHLADRSAFDATVARLRARHAPVPPDDRYRGENGAVAFADPDGRRVVLVPGPGQPAERAREVRVEPYTGPREELRPLFELAEDSPTELDSYLHAGTILVARSGPEVVGHLQLVDTDTTGQVELKNMAVREEAQGRGVGRRLVRAAVDLVRTQAGPAATLLVATAAADVGNLRFYQRQGFRMRAVERDAFTPADGYPAGIRIDGIPLRDRVWLDRPVDLPTGR
jgi:GNAT superfamily N-acetyltransferase